MGGNCSHKDKAGALVKLTEVASSRSSETIERALVVAREMLGMEVSFVSEFTEDQMLFRKLSGDAASFGWGEGQAIPLTRSFCKRVVEGSLPNVVPDAQDDECAKDHDLTEEAVIGSYIGVPVQLSNGHLYGMLCCLSHSPDPSLRERDEKFMNVLARLIADQLEREELQIRATAVGALLTALEARDGYTGEHSEAVVELSTAVARRMGLSEEEVEKVEQVALLHDIGKLGVPDEILRKRGPLDNGEWEVMREHTLIGERIVFSMEGLARLAPVIRAEHERWDGKGYPDGLAGEQIPLASRIVFTCDAYHAMTSDRSYREALGVQAALAELQKNAGTQFCPHTVPALLDVVKGSRHREEGRSC